MGKGRSRGRGRGPVYEGEVQRPLRIASSAGTRRLGDLTGQDGDRDPVDAVFGYFGEDIRVNPDLTEVDIIDFLDKANRVEKTDPQAMIMVKDAARVHIHPDDFDRFWELRKKHRQGIEQIMGTVWGIVAAVTERPTGRPSASSDGPPDTSQSSPVPSSQPAGGPSLRDRFLRHIERYEAMGTPMGVAMAAQIATMAESQGVDVSRDDPSLARTG